MTIDYVSTPTTKMTWKRNGKTESRELLWGDRVEVLSTSGSKAKVKARARTGEIAKSALGGEPLLEVYFIDVGQGDGVLIVIPDRRHVLIDGGYIRNRQPTGKNAADFVD